MKRGIIFAFLLLLSASALADVTMVYPAKETVKVGSSVQMGDVSRGETFDLAFSDNSGHGFPWAALSIGKPSLPPGWELVSVAVNDTSLVAKIRVPQSARPGSYVLSATLSNPEAGSSESVGALVTVKEGTLDVSFVRATSNIASVGDKVEYKAVVSNNSIAPETVRLSSNLPSNWFKEKTVELKPNTSQEVNLVVSPLASGNHNFSFSAYSVQKGTVVKSFSSELKVRPTLKGKLASMFSGFPFFTFTLLPFQLLDSYLSLLFY